MRNALFFSVVLTVAVISCRQGGVKQTVAPAETTPVITISELITNPVEYGDKLVRIDGVIDHMCRNSGQKMRVKEDGSDLSIEIQLGSLASEFSVELEGKAISLEGVLKYTVANRDALGEDAPQHGNKGEEHDCETEKAVAEALKAKGLDPSINVFINMTRYEIR